MRKYLAGSIALVALVAATSAYGADASPATPGSAGGCDPYKTYSCLDAYLGEYFWYRLYNYYRLEWGHDGPPADPSAPPSRRAGWPTTPESTPPMPFTEWPYGGTTTLGVTRPNSIDSPLMSALGNTQLGKTMSDAHIQVYGWVNVGGNMSNMDVKPGGNFPASYMYTPNTVQLDQAVLYIERLPDTVQTDHIDWGFRFSGLYGENYRYTTSYGLGSYQLLGHNLVNGWDLPMMYGEVFVPNAAPEGLLIRFGRFISLPDIEAQLAPNNYMYSHSLTYAFDNYTNTGIQTTWGLTKNLFVQLGVTVGTEAPVWHWGAKIPNPFPNPLFPDTTMLKDPGAKPSVTGCVRYQTDSGNDNVYFCADAINDGTWGYNNLQWYGMTYYHKFNDEWHISWEMWSMHQNNVINLNNPAAQVIIANGGTPFSNPFSGIAFNAPNGALCDNPNVLSCTASEFSTVAYLNYKFTPLDNLSLRGEFFNDMQGQRTGVKTRYLEGALGWQHWLSPQIEMRPEITYYKSLDAPAFDGNFNVVPAIAPSKSTALIGAMDVIMHF
jgi:hypothetical protein